MIAKGKVKGLEATLRALEAMRARCRPGRDCPGPRLRIALGWPENEDSEAASRASSDPCPVCGRRFDELTRAERAHALGTAVVLLDDGTPLAG